jgi:NADH-quinone oxidoreductase subunit H
MLESFTSTVTTTLTSHLGELWGGYAWTFAKSLFFIVLVVGPLLGFVLYFQIIERWVIGWIQVRRGPIRVGPWGFGQPFADAIKLLLKEQIIPSGASKALFILAPVIAVAPSLGVWALVPFAPEAVIANVDAGLLVVLAMTSMGVYGIILAGWASNSKYAFLGALRTAAQMVSYEIAMGFALIGPLLAGQSMNLTQIVNRQGGNWGFFEWFWIPLFPLFIIHFIAGIAETNRAPFDMAESESELVAGFHVEYSGMTFALFFLAEYANMVLVAALSSILFIGGWLSPFNFGPDVPLLGAVCSFLQGMPWVGWIFKSGFHWLAFKMSFLLFMFLWIRATFPRYRYDQVMRLGWKVFIPITIVWLLVVAAAMLEPFNNWPILSLWFGTKA